MMVVLSVDSPAFHFLGFSGVLFTSAMVLLLLALGTSVAALPLPNSVTKSAHDLKRKKKVKETGLAVIPAREMQKQEDLCELKSSLV